MPQNMTHFNIEQAVELAVKSNMRETMEVLLFNCADYRSTNDVDDCQDQNLSAFRDRLSTLGIQFLCVEAKVDIDYSQPFLNNLDLLTTYDRWAVYKFYTPGSQCFVKILGRYSSYTGTEYVGNWFFVSPTEKSITVYESTTNGKFIGD